MDHFDAIQEGLRHHEAFRYSEALTFFEEAWREYPRCAASVYNYANTLHMLDRDTTAKELLSGLIETSDAVLCDGCRDGRESPRSFKLDAYFLLYHVTFHLTGSYEESLPYAKLHLKHRARGVKSLWTRKQVVRQIAQDSTG